MNLKQAQYFSVIAKNGSITNAAKELYISQPSLSQMLKNVEDELGIKLFDRSKTPLQLTYAGERYLRVAEMMLAANEKLEVELQAIKHEDSGRLRLGISVSRGMQVLPYVLPKFKSTHPNVKIEISEGGSANLEYKLESGQIDIALAALDTISPKFTYELLEKEIMGIIAGKDSVLMKKFRRGDSVRIADLEGIPFVYLKEGHSSRITQDILFKKAHFQPEMILETDSLDLARSIVLNSDACMLCPNIYSNNVVDAMGGAFFPLANYKNNRHFYACRRLDDYQPKYSKDFVDEVKIFLKSIK